MCSDPGMNCEQKEAIFQMLVDWSDILLALLPWRLTGREAWPASYAQFMQLKASTQYLYFILG